jgi:hypothetical protein
MQKLNLILMLAALMMARETEARNEDEDYLAAIQRTAGMVTSREAQEMVRAQGLNLLNLTWEDTGRYKGSSVGPNISDMTIQVGATNREGRFAVTCMPVIRFPNFADTSCDLDPQDFTILVGNERGRPLKRISLHDFLAEPRRYLSDPSSWPGTAKSLLAPRDSRVLVSAQACFLPVPRGRKATFNPVVFNYQSAPKNPAVLTILATREGTSVTIIDNQRDAFAVRSVWGQRLFFNAAGQRTSLTGQRASEFVASNDASGPGLNTSDQKGETGLNLVLLVQVPLKHKESPRTLVTAMPAAKLQSVSRDNASDVENAVIGHGDEEGPFTEIDGLPVERDPRFPIRVTVQFYKATATGQASPDDIVQIRRQIDRVYAQSDYVGSLVTGGDTGRVTEYEGRKVMPHDWWETFWEHYESTYHESRAEAQARLRQLLGRPYEDRAVSRLYVRDLLRQGQR